MSFFDELAELDRPWVDVKFSLRGRVFNGKARRPNAAEQDALDAFAADEYARQVVAMTEPQDGKQSELDTVRTIYSSVPRSAIVEQIVATRIIEIRQAALQRSGIDVNEEALKEKDLSEDEQKAARETREKKLAEIIDIVRGEVSAEYDTRTDEELVETLSQININIKAQRKARMSQHAEFLYYTLHDGDFLKVFPSAEAARERLTAETLSELADTVQDSYLIASLRDLPFESPGVEEPSGPQQSATTSAPETTPSSPGGKRTRRTRTNSKQST